MARDYIGPIVTLGDVEDKFTLPTNPPETADQLFLAEMECLAPNLGNEDMAKGFDLGKKYMELMNHRALEELKQNPRKARVYARASDGGWRSNVNKYNEREAA